MSATSRPSKPVKQTYSSKASRQRLPSSPTTSTLSSDTVIDSASSLPRAPSTADCASPRKRKRQEGEDTVHETPVASLYSSPLFPFGKKRRTTSLLLPTTTKMKKENRATSSTLATSSPSAMSKAKVAKPSASSSLTQLHLSFTTSIRTCDLCGLSYTRGAPDDEHLHKSHCARVTRGMEWGKEEDRSPAVQVVEEGVRLKDGRRGRIICFRAEAKGKVHAKANTLMETINLALSSPALPAATLAESKIYLFLLSPEGSSSQHREKITGCVIASRIKTAMKIVARATEGDVTTTAERERLVWVDGEDGGIFCDPTPLPTTMGIPRIFVPSEYRHKGVASILLSAAAKSFVYGYPLDPAKGEIAFSQPTGAGRGVMLNWGKGGIRIFEE